MQNSGTLCPMTHHRVMTSPTRGIGFASLFLNPGVLHLFRREMVHLCRIKPHVRYQMSRSRNQGKNKNFLISGFLAKLFKPQKATVPVLVLFNLVSTKILTFKSSMSSGEMTFSGFRRSFPVSVKFWPFRPIKTAIFEGRSFLRSKIVESMS